MDAAASVAADLRAAGCDGPVFVPTYQWVALLKWHGVDARQIDGASRPSHFTRPPESPTGLAHAVVCAESFLPRHVVQASDVPDSFAVTLLLFVAFSIKSSGGWSILRRRRTRAKIPTRIGLTLRSV